MKQKSGRMKIGPPPSPSGAAVHDRPEFGRRPVQRHLLGAVRARDPAGDRQLAVHPGVGQLQHAQPGE